jgi:hypothetical protein
MFRTKLVLKYNGCGKKSDIRTEPMLCKHYGYGYFWRCHKCKQSFSVDKMQVSRCLDCGWMVCPFCESCGCDYKR